MEVSKSFTFEASHILPHHPGKCSNLHGHSWKLHVVVNQSLNKETGMVVDYGDLKKLVQPIVDELDHAHLGAWHTNKVTIDLAEDMFGVPNQALKRVPWLEKDGSDKFNPTSENILVEIGRQIVRRGGVFWRLILEETCTTACTLEWSEFNAIISNK